MPTQQIVENLEKGTLDARLLFVVTLKKELSGQLIRARSTKALLKLDTTRGNFEVP